MIYLTRKEAIHKIAQMDAKHFGSVLTEEEIESLANSDLSILNSLSDSELCVEYKAYFGEELYILPG